MLCFREGIQMMLLSCTKKYSENLQRNGPFHFLGRTVYHGNRKCFCQCHFRWTQCQHISANNILTESVLFLFFQAMELKGCSSCWRAGGEQGKTFPSRSALPMLSLMLWCATPWPARSTSSPLAWELALLPTLSLWKSSARACALPSWSTTSMFSLSTAPAWCLPDSWSRTATTVFSVVKSPQWSIWTASPHGLKPWWVTAMTCPRTTTASLTRITSSNTSCVSTTRNGSPILTSNPLWSFCISSMLLSHSWDVYKSVMDQILWTCWLVTLQVFRMLWPSKNTSVTTVLWLGFTFMSPLSTGTPRCRSTWRLWVTASTRSPGWTTFSTTFGWWTWVRQPRATSSTSSRAPSYAARSTSTSLRTSYSPRTARPMSTTSLPRGCTLWHGRRRRSARRWWSF